MFFSSWDVILRVIIIGALAYVSLVLLLHTAGKRTLSQMSAFDLVVSVAIGSVLATIILDKEIKLAEGITAMGLLIAIQFIGAWLSVRFKFVERIIKATPELLFYNGDYFYSTMKKQRVLEVEILQAARTSGISSMEDVEAVVLEANGNISVLEKSKSKENPTISDVKKKEK